MALTRVVVDPVTRIEGHLRIEAVVENGVITDAYSAGTMVRGSDARRPIFLSHALRTGDSVHAFRCA